MAPEEVGGRRAVVPARGGVRHGRHTKKNGI